MSVYAVIQASAIINVINWDGATPFTPPTGATLELLSALPAGVGVGWTLIGSTWTAPTVIPQTTSLTYQMLTQLFTAAELTAIMTAAATKPVIITWLIKMSSFTGGINLSDPQVTTALTYLVAQSLITSARATAIQAGTIMNPGA